MSSDQNEHPLIDGHARIMKAEVTAVGRVAPRMAEVTIAGPDLREMPILGPDQFLYLFIPRRGEAAPDVDYDFDWARWRQMPEDERPIGRYYTVRRFRREQGEIDLHMVLHGDGPLTGWAARARRGDRVALWGPRAAFHLPGDANTVFLAADEAGLPALASILESLPDGMHGAAFVEVEDAGEEQPLRAPGGIDLWWLPREGRPYGERLLGAVTSRTQPAGPAYAWVAGEASLVSQLRRHFRDSWGLPGDRVCAIGYWHRSRR